ncbi:MAG: L,D-transpeptidase, partial [Coriobacteriales bacterium]|nr:L,D-transpeptidase [Coriobacteriales bacterium]
TVAAIQDEILAVGEKNAAVIAVKGEIDTEDPKVTTPGQAIYVDTNACRVHLYENGSEVKSYPCTPGKSGYSTPKGDWKLSYKDASPTWYNPHSEWAADMPESVPPGPNNPLGLRALAVSCGGGIFLHGTTNTGQLGSPGSHGCVRIANSDIVELYNRVSAGIPIFIR